MWTIWVPISYPSCTGCTRITRSTPSTVSFSFGSASWTCASEPRVGGAARRVLETSYSFDAHADAYSKLLESVAGGRP